jgi:hypothetical protein
MANRSHMACRSNLGLSAINRLRCLTSRQLSAISYVFRQIVFVIRPAKEGHRDNKKGRVVSSAIFSEKATAELVVQTYLADR